MALDLRELTAIRTLPKALEAEYFNRIRLALLRVSDPLYVEVPRLNMEFQLERDAWLGRSALTGVPLLAWTAFEVQRHALHEPVYCLLHLYHTYAGTVMGSALPALDAVLKVHFAQAKPLATQRPTAIY